MQTATILFTDLVGSTTTFERLGPHRADRVRREHFALLRKLVEAHGGRVVKTLGDGVMSGFPAATGAARCAIAMQCAATDGDVAVRVGLSSGDVRTDADGDLHGRAVVEASRLCGAAAPRQILMADHALALLGDAGVAAHAPQTVELRGLGAVTVRTLEWASVKRRSLRVVLADDSMLIREGVARLLDALPGFEVVEQAADGDGLLEAVDRQRPDLVITDMRMPPDGHATGLVVTRELRRRHPGTRVVVLSATVEPDVADELVAHGDRGLGYLHKDAVGEVADFVATLRLVADGGCVLDPSLGARRP